jgi:hypothetical protein
MLRSFFLILLAVSLAAPASAGTLDRCNSFKQEVRRAHFYEFGLSFPWWYGVAQIQQESLCRDVISMDGVGSQGLSQVTWKWWGKHLKKVGIMDLSTARNQLRAQAFVMKDAQNQNRHKKLWVAYQIYNGGRLVLKEIKRAGIVDHKAARAECRRKIITFSNGQQISACDINYEYPELIYKYADRYRTGADSRRYEFW